MAIGDVSTIYEALSCERDRDSILLYYWQMAQDQTLWDRFSEGTHALTCVISGWS